MTKEEFKALGLTDEQAAECAKASKKELENFVSKDKLALAEQAKNTLELQAKEYDKQIKSLQKNVSDTDKLNATINELQEANKQAKLDYQNQINSMKINQLIDNAITGAKAKNLKAVKALIDVDTLDFDSEKGTLNGLDKQLEALQKDKSTSFLFDTPANPKDGKPNSGIKPSEGTSGDINTESAGAKFAQAYNAMNVPSTGKE